MTYNVLMGR